MSTPESRLRAALTLARNNTLPIGREYWSDAIADLDKIMSERDELKYRLQTWDDVHAESIDAQGRTDLLDSNRAMQLARNLLEGGIGPEALAREFLRVQAEALSIGRMEVGVGGQR